MISRRFYRQDCTKHKNIHIKDLRKLGRDLKDIIILDDTAQCMKMQPQNGLVIKSFYLDMRDKELIRLMPFLVFLSEMDDLRTVKTWFNKFNDEDHISYTDRHKVCKILNRNDFLKEVVEKIHTDHLDIVFHGQDGDKNVVIAPSKSFNKKPIFIFFDAVHRA